MPYRQFTRDERIVLKAYLLLPLSLRDIAGQMKRHIGSVSREVAKGGGRVRYSVAVAQKATTMRRKAANQQHRKLGVDEPLTQRVVDLLTIHWSPEQIVGRMKLEHYPGSPSFSAIYGYVNPKPELAKLLTRKHNKYRHRHGISQREQRRKELEAKRNIATRPKVVDERTRIGDWEGDTIIGTEKKERILTHTERKSGYLLGAKTATGEAECIREQTERAFSKIATTKKITITYDNGVEFADWEQTEKATKTITYFANPYHSWERGTSENTNGLVRRYFPKGTAFATLKPTTLAKAIKQINHRPRKRHGYRTPYEVFYGVAV
jgi:IS30 family transposase